MPHVGCDISLFLVRGSPRRGGPGGSPATRPSETQPAPVRGPRVPVSTLLTPVGAQALSVFTAQTWKSQVTLRGLGAGDSYWRGGWEM